MWRDQEWNNDLDPIVDISWFCTSTIHIISKVLRTKRKLTPKLGFRTKQGLKRAIEETKANHVLQLVKWSNCFPSRRGKIGHIESEARGIRSKDVIQETMQVTTVWGGPLYFGFAENRFEVFETHRMIQLA